MQRVWSGVHDVREPGCPPPPSLAQQPHPLVEQPQQQFSPPLPHSPFLQSPLSPFAPALGNGASLVANGPSSPAPAPSPPPLPPSPAAKPKKRHLCPKCSESFSQKGTLNRHIKETHEDARQFACSHAGCRKTFVRKKHLDDHLQTHAGRKDFVCEYPNCHKEFSQQSSLRRHHARAHNSSGSPRVSTQAALELRCDCGQAFKKDKGLRRHRKLHCELRARPWDLERAQGVESKSDEGAHNGGEQGGGEGSEGGEGEGAVEVPTNGEPNGEEEGKQDAKQDAKQDVEEGGNGEGESNGESYLW